MKVSDVGATSSTRVLLPLVFALLACGLYFWLPDIVAVVGGIFEEGCPVELFDQEFLQLRLTPNFLPVVELPLRPSGPLLFAFLGEPEDALVVFKSVCSCCEVVKFTHSSVPLEGSPVEDRVGWRTGAAVSHVLVPVKKQHSAELDRGGFVLFIFPRLRQHAKYFWVPGLSSVVPDSSLPSAFSPNTLMGTLRTFATDSVGFVRSDDSRRVFVVQGVDGKVEDVTSEFVACNETRRRMFVSRYPKHVASGSDGELVRHKVRKMLFSAKLALDGLAVPFWLSSGTFLGWHRQCDVIPYTDDVDIGVFAENYDPKIVEAMEGAGFVAEHRFGLLNDSYQIAFMHTWFKLDIFFFYKDNDHYWNGGTVAVTGEKLKYFFPKFKLCWSEFLGLLVRVPCHSSDAYAEANYGVNWFDPVREWDWKTSAANVVANGRWDLDKDDAVHFFDRG